MNEIQVSKSIQDMLWLISCALHGEIPDSEKVRALNLEQMYQAARFHTLTALTAMALESSETFRDAAPEQVRKWKEAKEKAIRKNMLLDAEREQIIRYMEQAGIWYMPMKGSILKDMYPKYGMRQMADNDIFYDGAYQAELYRFLTERGYQAESIGEKHHDIYKKPPVYNFELHRELIGKLNSPVWYAYYKEVKDRLIKDEGNAFGYHFTDEDFYIYMVVHACKHYNVCGTGLRILTDIYVYVENKKDSLNWTYLEGELVKLEIADFERLCRTLAQKLFSAPVDLEQAGLTEKEQELLCDLSGSGAYGTAKYYIEKSMKEIQRKDKAFTVTGKLCYLWKRLFPDMEWYQKYAPFFAGHRWLIPFYLVFRIFRGICFRWKKLRNELRIVKHAGKDRRTHLWMI